MPTKKRLTKNNSLVRLTGEEFRQLKLLKKGDRFRHINLQHYGIPYELTVMDYFYAVEIKKHGINNGTIKPPVLNTKHLIKLKLLNLTHSIPINKIPKEYLNNNLVLHNKLGIPQSLCDKYGSVMSLSADAIVAMKCYIREFQII